MTLTHSPDTPSSSDLLDTSDDPYSHSLKRYNRFSRFLRKFLFGALIISLTLLGCGPEPDESNSADLISETERIAQNYVASKDISTARAALSSMSVANSNQWLVYVTETSINQSPDAAVTRSLIELCLDLGLSSAAIEQRAIALGLLVPTPAIASRQEQAPAVQSTPASAPEPAQAPVEAPAELPTAIPEEAPTPTEAPSDPVVAAISGINVRFGPGTAYQIVGSLEAGESASAIGKSPAGDWWQVALSAGQVGWVFGQLVSPSGNFDDVQVAVDIPALPPTPVPVPPTAVPIVEEPTAVAPPRSGNDFVLIEKRLWSAQENGGRMDGPSVVCGEKRELHVRVVDAAGNLLDGVAIQAQYGAKEIFLTGAQGKGDGKSEFVLGGGQDVKVVKDVDGRDVTSDLAAGLVTVPGQIPFEYLISAGYCTDDASCQKNVVDPYACGGHFSWDVKFQRSY